MHIDLEFANIIFFDVVPASKDLANENLFTFTAAGVVPVAAVKRLAIHQYTVDYIFRVLWVHKVHF